MNRIKKLQSLMIKKRLSCVILTTENEDYNNNIFYYTGFKGYAIFIVRKNSAVLLVPELEFLKAKRTGVKVIVLEKKFANLSKVVGKHKFFGVDKTKISVSSFERLKKLIGGRYKDVSLNLLSIRSVKDKKEILTIKKACSICDAIFSKIVKNFKFKTEKELATFVEMEMRSKGLVPSFNCIVASGKSSSIVHHNNEKKISKGFLILDFGVKVGGYCSDMTRTIYVGKPSVAEKKMYEKLLDVQRKTIKNVMPGKKCSDLCFFAKKELGKDGEFFIHGLGHGVGLDIHELPSLKEESKEILKAGNVITIEPGVYFENKYGIRLEDTILVGKKGPINLSKSSKQLFVI